MDDLISRKAAIDRLNATPPGNWSKARYTRELWNVPSNEAVPLEPLCQWLAGYAAPPQYALDAVTEDPIDPQGVVYTANRRAEAWKYHFRELLKSGLMDTEGNRE